jgi:hypothetical protein
MYVAIALYLLGAFQVFDELQVARPPFSFSFAMGLSVCWPLVTVARLGMVAHDAIWALREHRRIAKLKKARDAQVQAP